LFGDLAVAAYFIICKERYFGVTSSAAVINIALIDSCIFTSPILSIKYDIAHYIVLLFIFSQFLTMQSNIDTIAFWRFIFDSFQSFIFVLTNFATASSIVWFGYFSIISFSSSSNPYFLSCHLSLSNNSTVDELKNWETLSQASSLLKPEPKSSSSITGALGGLEGPDDGAAFGFAYVETEGAFFGGATSSCFISSSSYFFGFIPIFFGGAFFGLFSKVIN
jgi:hypothetical protein